MNTERLLGTTNQGFSRYGDFLVEENIAVPIVDRRIQHARIIMLGGEGYRQKSEGSSTDLRENPLGFFHRHPVVQGVAMVRFSAYYYRVLSKINLAGRKDTIDLVVEISADSHD